MERQGLLHSPLCDVFRQWDAAKVRGRRATDPYITFALHNLFHTAASICRFLDPSFFSEIDYHPLVKTACDVKITFK